MYFTKKEIKSGDVTIPKGTRVVSDSTRGYAFTDDKNEIEVFPEEMEKIYTVGDLLAQQAYVEPKGEWK